MPKIADLVTNLRLSLELKDIRIEQNNSMFVWAKMQVYYMAPTGHITQAEMTGVVFREEALVNKRIVDIVCAAFTVEDFKSIFKKHNISYPLMLVQELQPITFADWLGNIVADELTTKKSLSHSM